MNMVGFRLAMERAEVIGLDPEGTVEAHVAPLTVLTVLKMAAYQDRPAERRRDLEDLSHILVDYLPPEDERNYDAAIWDAGLEGDQASAFALGQDVRKIVDNRETSIVEAMIALLIGDADPSTHLLEMSVSGHSSWFREVHNARRAVQAFAKGFQGS